MDSLLEKFKPQEHVSAIKNKKELSTPKNWKLSPDPYFATCNMVLSKVIALSLSFSIHNTYFFWGCGED